MNENRLMPAIARHFVDGDRDINVRSTPYDTVTFMRGFGDSGRKLQIVDMTCPSQYCSFDRMLRQWRVSPVDRDTVRYYCLSPNCPHYHDGVFDYAMPAPSASEPTVTEVDDE